MNNNDVSPTEPAAPEPGDLIDGFSIDELAAYLDAGRKPTNPAIDNSAECQLALDAIIRTRQLLPALLSDEGAQRTSESFIGTLLGRISPDLHAGATLVMINDEAARSRLAITEGALRGLVRSAELAVPSVLIGRISLTLDPDEETARLSVGVDASVPYGVDIPALANEIRDEIARLLVTNTTWVVGTIDVTVHDVRVVNGDES